MPSRFRLLLPLGTLLIFLTGCATRGVNVTGTNQKDHTFKGTQSETASTDAYFSNTLNYIVTYNDDTDDGKIVYTTNDRVVYPGASMLGWSYSKNGGKSWTYGGKVKPPSGMAALWGDPAIVTSNTNYGRVYISSLAIAASKIPATGHHGWLDDGSITGACIARSDDGGIHFAIQSCVSQDNDFYDGSSMAAGAGGDQRVFAAFRDVPQNRIDVWASPDGIDPFAKLPDPFPGKSITSHPRLAYDRSTGALLVAAIESGSQLIYINRLVGNTWQTPTQASFATTRVDIKVGAQTIRMAYGFSFDVGAPSITELDNGFSRVNNDAIRLLYTTRDAQTQRLYVRGSACNNNLSTCQDAPEWGTTPGNLNTPRDQWNPTVTAWPGFIGLPPEWKATYETTDDDPNAVSIKQGNLAVLPDGKRLFLPFDFISPRPICPDFRYGSPGSAVSGYWGDYDEKGLAGFANNSSSPQFLLAFSDSSKGCISQSEFTSTHLHVSAAVFE